VTASDVADGVGGKRRLAHRRLKQLEEAGRLQSKKTGGRSKVWYLRCPEQ
jgi:predicted ArsR family transcriptional regulator